MSIIYNIAYIVFLFFYVPVFFLRKRKRHGIGLRLGLYSKEIIKELADKKNIWVHAVSVGEVFAVSALVKSMHKRYPGYRIIFTTVTETGNAAAKKILEKDDVALYLPFDISFVIKRVLYYIKPRCIIITETELWPNLISCAHNKGIKIFLVNGRISDKSFKRYMLIKPLLQPLLRRIDLSCMQTQEGRNRASRLGAFTDSVVVSGNMKFDSAFLGNPPQSGGDSLKHALGIGTGKRIIVAGSTHKGEEAVVLDTFRRLVKQYPDIILVLAPRHIERAREVARQAEKNNFRTMYFSEAIKKQGGSNQRISCDSIIIVDVIGQLKGLYSIAEIVFIGGSLVRKGGQNMIEPAVFAKPIVLGPYTDNFRDIVDVFLKENAVMIAKSKHMFFNIIESLLADKFLGRCLGERARHVVDSNTGSTERTLNSIENKKAFL
jgi:3-deoxy-D-manno-octulosonic-acid transferase